MTQGGSLARFVRRHDPDRYLTALFAPAERRETLFVLYAFNHELARAWEAASQVLPALIRLQWWREVVEGSVRAREVATPLTRELAAGRLDRSLLLALIEGRERIETGLHDAADWQAYAKATGGALAEAAGRALGAAAELPRLRCLGTGYAVAGLLRSRGQWAGGMSAAPPPELRPQLAAWARDALGRPAPLRSQVIAAGLVSVLARRDLQHSAPAVRGVGDRLAVAVAALRGIA